MRIAINAADFDHARIDGTRIYIQNMLKNFGPDAGDRDQFFIYHKNEFNPELAFPIFKNYKIKNLKFPFWWTQTRFAWEIFREKNRMCSGCRCILCLIFDQIKQKPLSQSMISLSNYSRNFFQRKICAGSIGSRILPSAMPTS